MDDSKNLPRNKVVEKKTCSKCGMTMVSNLAKCIKCGHLLERMTKNVIKPGNHNKTK